MVKHKRRFCFEAPYLGRTQGCGARGWDGGGVTLPPGAMIPTVIFSLLLHSLPRFGALRSCYVQSNVQHALAKI